MAYAPIGENSADDNELSNTAGFVGTNEKESLFVAPTKKEGTSGVLRAVFNLSNTILGAGIIGLPFAIARCGFVMGIILLFVVAIVTEYMLNMLIETGVKVDAKSYESLCEKSFGKPGFYFVSLFMALFGFGAMIAYAIIIGDVFPPVLRQLVDENSFVTDRRFVIGVTGIVIILPICLLRDMTNLSYTSFLSISVLVAILALVFIKILPNNITPPDTADGPFVFVRSSVFAGIGTMAFAFSCMEISFIIFSSLQDSTIENWRRVTKLSLLIGFLLSASFAIIGYLGFYTETCSNYLENFPDDDLGINIARIFFGITMFFTFPMQLFVSRQAVTSILLRSSDRVSSTLLHCAITILLWGGSLSVALFQSNLGFILELTGSLTASMLCYILPVCTHFSCSGFVDVAVTSVKCWDKTSDRYKQYFIARLQAVADFVFPLLIGIGGVCVLVVGTITTLNDQGSFSEEMCGVD